MESEKKYGWTREGLLSKLSNGAQLSPENCVVEAVEGNGTSVVVLMNSVGDVPISITMYGREVLADMVLFSLERDA